MSVLIPDLMVYEYVHNGLMYAANNSTCDGLYSPVIRQYMKDKKWDKECKRLVQSWYTLNELSYYTRYTEEQTGKPQYSIIKCNLYIPVEPVQLVKYLHCINYNIELPTIANKVPIREEEKRDKALLEAWEQDIYRAIVTSTKQYSDLPYSEFK